MTYMMKKQSSTGSSGSSSSPGRGTLGISQRDSRVISKDDLRRPKIRVIHIFPPEVIHAEVADFRDLVQRLTGKNSGKVTAKGKKVKPDVEAAVIRCDNPMVSPKLEQVMMMGTPGSSPSLSYSSEYHGVDHDDEYNWRPSSPPSSGYMSTVEVDDIFDFTSIFNMDESDDHVSHHDYLNHLFGETTDFHLQSDQL